MHAPGTIYGGSSAREAPVLLRVVARQRVRDVVMGWDTQSCSDGSYLVYPDAFQGFPLSRDGRVRQPVHATRRRSTTAPSARSTTTCADG